MKSRLNQFDYLKPHARFKFINENDLQKALDRVRRERIKLKEQEIWSEYCAKELQKLSLDDDSTNSRNQFDLDITKEHSEKILRNDSNWNTKNLEHHTLTDEMLLNEYKKLQKGTTLSYSNMTAISLPCPDAESEYQTKIKEVEERINFTCSKIYNVIEVIEPNLTNFREPETPAEGVRLHRKASEFCIRFSRNHSYQIESLFNQLINIADKDLKTKQDIFIYLQKTLKLFQSLLLGYYTFYRHMYVVWGYNGIADKLNSLLNITIKILNNPSTFRGIKEIIFLNDLKTIITRIMGFVKNFTEGKTPNWHVMCKKSPETRRVKSASSSVYAINSGKISTSSRFNNSNTTTVRRRVKSATTTVSSDQYYMYQNKQTMKNLYNCRFCHPHRTKNDDINVFKRLTTNPHKTKFLLAKQKATTDKENRKDFHKNCHNHKVQDAETPKKNPTDKNQKIHIITHKDSIKDPANSKIQISNPDNISLSDKDNEELLQKIIPMIADHFKGIYENATDKITKEDSKEKKLKKKDKEGFSDNCQSPDSPSHYFRDSFIKRQLETGDDILKIDCEIKSNKKSKVHKNPSSIRNAPKKGKKTQEDAETKEKISQINSISDDLINDELSMITMEMDTPLKRFIKRELRDFSDFMYKVHSINK